MTNSTTIDISSTLTQRFYRYLIDLKFALRAEDFDDGPLLISLPKDDKNFQSQPTERILLDVEKSVLNVKSSNKNLKHARLMRCLTGFILEFIKTLEKLLDIDRVQQSLLGLSINFNDLMDALLTRDDLQPSQVWLAHATV